MSRPRNPVPTYSRDRRRDTARCWVGGRWIHLGKWNSDESRREYERICAEIRASSVEAVAANPKHRLLVSEVALAFVKYAVNHYKDADGKPTGEADSYQSAVTMLCDLYGETAAADFGPLALKAVRQKMIERGWCRTHINRQVGRLRRVFKWGAGEELVPVAVHQALACIVPLQSGRTTARDTEPVEPVAREHVQATLPHLNRHTAAMVRLQMLTGMRPGEVCRLSLEQIDRTGELWVYHPNKHKTKYRGKVRLVVLGPQAKALIQEFVGQKEVVESAALFSPKAAREEWYASRRAARKTKVQPSQASRKKAAPKKTWQPQYTTNAYCHAVAKAADKAGVPSWHPNQLRHTFASEVRRTYGLEAAQVLLGHAKADVTQLYAERDLSLAAKVASAIG